MRASDFARALLKRRCASVTIGRRGRRWSVTIDDWHTGDGEDEDLGTTMRLALADFDCEARIEAPHPTDQGRPRARWRPSTSRAGSVVENRCAR